MPARVWQALAGLIVLLLVAVVGLDQWQARRGEASIFAFWAGARRAITPPPNAPVRPVPEPAPPPAGGAPRVAVIVDDLGSRRDVFELVRDLRRPVAVAVLPGLPLSASLAREASRAGMEVLLDLPMEPYRYPEMDPGPGALLMGMTLEELQRRLSANLDELPAVAGVKNHLGSRMTEDRTRMRAVLETLAARRLFLVDGYTSSLSVAYEEAKDMGVRAARRQILVDHARGEAGDRAQWDEVSVWAEQRGEVVVVAHGHPQTVRLLKEYVPRWEARGLRLVPVSQLAR